MKNRNFSILFLTFSMFLSLTLCVQAQEVKPTKTYDLKESIPVTPEIKKGVFENGMHYYLQTNKKPENRATFWLAVNVGSVLENDNQQGLAHFNEHMGFNGTEHFKKQELLDFLESIGMRFGPELNAYTSFDETVYYINVPTDSNYFIETGIQILEDWAHNMSMEADEIDKERGVVIEEWRLGRGARMRMQDKQFPIMFKNSRYAERLPIGKKEIIESFEYETVRQFYRDWYRPDLMAIVAVGDFDPDYIYGLMEKHFASIPKKENPRERVMYPVPDHDEVLFAIATDPEADRTEIEVYFKNEYEPTETVSDYRKDLTASLFNRMLNNRLDELTQQAEPPFLAAGSGQGRFVRTKGVYYLGANVKEDGLEKGLDALLTEAFRVKRYGFTASELERTKVEVLRQAERLLKEKDKTESRRLAQQYVYNFLRQDPIPSPQQRYDLYAQLLGTIELADVNKLADEWITENNRVVVVSAPEKESLAIPTEALLMEVFKKAEAKEIAAYEDNVSDEPLVARLPKKAKIKKEKYWEKLGVTEWVLENGVHVVLKPTDFKNDEIRFRAYSFGGSSLAPEKDYPSVRAATSIVGLSGLANFSYTDLQKKLTGKVVRVSPFIGSVDEGFNGSASPADIVTLFQLIYLNMTAPRMDETAFQSYLSRMKGYIENRSARPEVAWSDTINTTLSSNHYSSQPWTVTMLDKIDHKTAVEFYKERFADASNFHFFFVGNFEIEKIKPLVQTYLGGLPALNRNEKFKDMGEKRPAGIVKKEVKKGIEPKSRVFISLGSSAYVPGMKQWYELSSMTDVLDIKLREILREDMGGTYGVSVYPNIQQYPKPGYSVNISFGCDPERVNEMVTSIFTQLDTLKAQGPDSIYITKVHETHLRAYETNLKENGYWLNELYYKNYYGEDWMDIVNYPEFVKELSAGMIQNSANKYLDYKNMVQVVLYPEEKKEAAAKD